MSEYSDLLDFGEEDNQLRQAVQFDKKQAAT
jgi:hypothetical protein